MRIVVVRTGALGDVVLTLPALHVLRARYPAARIEVIGYPSVWRVVGPLVDSIIAADSPALAGLYSGSPTPELQSLLREVDLAVAWSTRDLAPVMRAAGAASSAGPRLPRVGRSPGHPLRVLRPAEVISASPYPPPGIHAARWLLETIFADDEEVSVPDSWRLSLDPEELERGRAALMHLGLAHPVVLHPGAGADWKRWQAQRFAAVGEELVYRGFQVLLIEGPADEEAIAEVQRYTSQLFPVMRDAPLRDLASVLAHSSAFAGNDSGVTHLAAAVGVPTLALFGPTDPVSWRPLGQARVLRHCQARAQWQGHIRVCQDEQCMEGITVGEVIDQVVSLACSRSPDQGAAQAK